MADNEDVSESESQLITEYKDGELQIVEVRPFDKDVMLDGEVVNSLSELEVDGETKYVQLLNASDKSMMQLDLLNLQLVKCDDGTETFTIVTSGDVSGEGDNSTVTCVLAGSDNETNEDSEGQEYMVMQGEQGPIMLLQSAFPEAQPRTEAATKPTTVETLKTVREQSVTTTNRTLKLSPVEILERAKALQKAKALILPPSRRGRKRKSDLPPPHELLSSPGFKLFLYSCKACSYKCNAIKDMRAHRLSEHTNTNSKPIGLSGGGPAGGGGKWRGSLQCARCPYKGHTHMQLMKHVQEVHLVNETSNKVYLNTEEVQAADVLVCGACGFESASRPAFKTHIEKEHGATAV